MSVCSSQVVEILLSQNRFEGRFRTERSSAKNVRSHLAYEQASFIAMCSASGVERSVNVCLLLFHE